MFRQKVTGKAYDANPEQSDRWTTFKNPREASSHSALMLAFACRLQEELGVPIGVINSSQGGTYIEEWLSNESLVSAGSSLDGSQYESLESVYYYGMTEQLRGLKIAGIVWCHGGNNATSEYDTEKFPNAVNGPFYLKQLRALYAQYLDIFGETSIPIIIDQQGQSVGNINNRNIRLAQMEFAETTENAYFAPRIDLSMQYDVHPVQKKDTGIREANIALEYVYKVA